MRPEPIPRYKRPNWSSVMHPTASSDKPMRGRIRNKSRSIGCRVVDASEPRASGSDPEPTVVINVERADTSRWRSVRVCEQHEAAVAVARKAAVLESNPDIARVVFGKCGRPAERGKAVRVGVSVEGSRGPLPSCEDRGGRRPSANPDIASRILEQREHIVTGQSIPRRVNRLGPNAPELPHVVHLGEPVQSGAAGYPPLARAVLKRKAGIDQFSHVFGQVRPDRGESGCHRSGESVGCC